MKFKNYLKCFGVVFSIIFFSFGMNNISATEKCDSEKIEKIKIEYVSSGKSNVFSVDNSITKVLHGSNINFDINSFYGKCAAKLENLDGVDIKVNLDGKKFTGYVDKKSNGEFSLYIPFGVSGNLNMEISLKEDSNVKDKISFEVVKKSLYGESTEVHPFYLFENKVDFNGKFKTISYIWNLAERKYLVKLPNNPFSNKDFIGWKVETDEFKDKIFKAGETLKLNSPSGYTAILAVYKNSNVWELKNGNWYYIENGETIKSKWIFDKNYNSWFYLKEDGKCAQNEWISSYYLKSNGEMAKSEWIYDENYNSWFYLKEDGSYARNEWIGKYYLKQWGEMAKSEWIFDGNYNSWFYLKEDGSYAENEWIGNYYLKSGGYLK